MTVLVAFLGAAFVDGGHPRFTARTGTDLPWALPYLADPSSAWVVVEVRGPGLSAERCWEFAPLPSGWRGDELAVPPIKRATGGAAAMSDFAEHVRGVCGREITDQMAAIFWAFNAERMSAGWPVPAFRGCLARRLVVSDLPCHCGVSCPQVGPLERYGIVAVKARQGAWKVEAELPVRPVWAGVAVDTIFYGCALWMLVRFPGRLGRFVRLRRGLCPACAYPAGVSPVCTECGMALRRTGGGQYPLPQTGMGTVPGWRFRYHAAHGIARVPHRR